MDLNGFNALEVEPSTTFQPLPADWYKCVITEAEERVTSKGDGSFLLLSIEVIAGDYSGRKVFDRLNLKNPNPTAVEIAQRSLSSICRSIGVNSPKDSSELCDKPMMVKLSVRPSDGQYDASNDVKGYEAVTGGSSDQPAASGASSNSGSTPPWKTKKDQAPPF
tara:strand:- start:756 stop:1247 length:492 start_codon:yes stop_codon:yes gene_type:complete